MNPRYPTTRQFRRHRNERKWGRPLLALGLLAGVALYWIFSGPSTPKRQPEMTSQAETRALEEDIAAHLKTTHQVAPTPSAAPASEAGRKEPTPELQESRRAAVIDPPSLTDPTGRLDAPENPPVVDPIIKDPARVAALKNLSATPTRKSGEESKSKGASKTGEGKGDAGKEGSAVHEAKKEPPPKEEGGMPSAPNDLPPKSRPPDLDMTFYRELPKRKVVVPLEDPLDQSGKPVAAVAEAKPGAQAEKNSGRHGAYIVQLAVFNDSQRASAMVADLQRRGVPAKVVKSKEGTLYRVRLGPFPTQAEATRMMNQWKLGGQSPLIFPDHEG
ncbi:MAG: SPOR domain-containing protein [Magnetococcales bacterium]|nr:SPOR domain-containing protein [Magnetococcales bacterium]